MLAVGQDIGHSAVKVAARTQTLFPTAAVRAPAEGVNTGLGDSLGEVVMVNGARYLTGEDALIQSGGRAVDPLSDDWVSSPEYLALLKTGYRVALRSAGMDPSQSSEVILGLGLPSRLFKAQKKAVKEGAAACLGLPGDAVVVVPQSLAALYAYLLAPTGTPAQVPKADGRWIVVDVGYYTTDFGLVERRRWSDVGEESIGGAYLAAKALRRLIAAERGFSPTIREASDALYSRVLHDEGEVVPIDALVDQASESLVESVMGGIESTFGTDTLHNAAGIMLAGGGSILLADAARRRWKHVTVPEQARFAVAEGLRRIACGVNLLRAA
ncbi:MAG TPA: ParM/StbA family protein [Rhodanobacteraceae bacterium]